MSPLTLAGIDEAGLGPILGPYTAALVRFRAPQKIHLFSSLHPLVQNVPHKGSLLVADSKKVYSQKKGLEALEKAILSFYCLKQPFPQTMQTYLSAITSGSFNEKNESTPWYHNLSSMELPLAADKNEILDFSQQLRENLDTLQLEFAGISLALSTETNFNQLLSDYTNKARVCQIILNPLMLQAMQEENLELHVDRQGGRRYYGEWLMELTPGKPLKALKEMKELSVYQCENRNIHFQVGADNTYLETALASMFAKYTREVLMKSFNQYWRSHFPDLKPTAGYYTDGKRLLRELAAKGVSPEIVKNMERQR